MLFVVKTRLLLATRYSLDGIYHALDHIHNHIKLSQIRAIVSHEFSKLVDLQQHRSIDLLDL